MTQLRPCSVSECPQRSRARGLCWSHYNALRCHGDATRTPRPIAPRGAGTLKNGYRQISVGDGRRVLEHRYIIECAIGRRLGSNEVVHHRNGNRLDNRPENLELMPPSEHTRRHVHERHPWNTETVKRCPDCLRLLDRSVFCADQYRSDGLQSICRRCCRDRKRRARARDGKAIRLGARQA